MPGVRRSRPRARSPRSNPRSTTTRATGRSAIAREHDARRFVDLGAIDARAPRSAWASGQRAEGVYYTPRIVARARHAAARDARRRDGRPRRPGVRRRRAARAALGRAPLSTLYGVDLDPIRSRSRAAGSSSRPDDGATTCDGRARFVCADTLGAPLDALFPSRRPLRLRRPDREPPFGGAVARDTGRTDEERARPARDFLGRGCVRPRRALRGARAAVDAPGRRHRGAGAARALGRPRRRRCARGSRASGPCARGSAWTMARSSAARACTSRDLARPGEPEALEVVELQRTAPSRGRPRGRGRGPVALGGPHQPLRRGARRDAAEQAARRAHRASARRSPWARRTRWPSMSTRRTRPPARRGQGALFEPDTAPVARPRGTAGSPRRGRSAGVFVGGARAALPRPAPAPPGDRPRRCPEARRPRGAAQGAAARPQRRAEAAYDPDGAYAGAVASLSITALEEERPAAAAARALPQHRERAGLVPAHYAALALAGGSVRSPRTSSARCRCLMRSGGGRATSPRARGCSPSTCPRWRGRPPPLAWWGEARALALTARPSAWRGALWLLAGEQANARGERTVEERLSLASVAVLGCARVEDDDGL